MQTRLATIDDLPQLKALSLRAWSRYQLDLSEAQWQKMHQHLNNDATYADLLIIADCIIAEMDGLVAGMAFLVPNGNPTDIYDSDWCYIRLLGVDPAFTGKGIARHITNACITMAKENGETTIALHTSEIMPEARHIYESLGFTILRELEPRFEKKYWLYIKSL